MSKIGKLTKRTSDNYALLISWFPKEGPTKWDGWSRYLNLKLGKSIRGVTCDLGHQYMHIIMRVPCTFFSTLPLVVCITKSHPQA